MFLLGTPMSYFAGSSCSGADLLSPLEMRGAAVLAHILLQWMFLHWYRLYKLLCTSSAEGGNDELLCVRSAPPFLGQLSAHTLLKGLCLQCSIPGLSLQSCGSYISHTRCSGHSSAAMHLCPLKCSESCFAHSTAGGTDAVLQAMSVPLILQEL